MTDDGIYLPVRVRKGHVDHIEPGIYLYAELLINIRQVTLYASLATERNEDTDISFSSDRNSISLSHGSEKATVALPTQIAGSAKLSVPPERAKELNFRLQIEAADAPYPLQNGIGENEVPWSASDLKGGCQIACRQCKTLVVDRESITHWKDLPSENWAEMMDFWHCHKPDVHHDHDGDHAKAPQGGSSVITKGYSASNRIMAAKGTGFIDLSYFLLSRDDCTGLEVRGLASLI